MDPTAVSGRPRVQFDPASHRYTLAGTVLPSVTHILDRMGHAPDFSGVSADILDAATARGRLVHALTARLDQTGLLDPVIDGSVLAYVQQYRRFVATVQPRYTHIEYAAGSLALRYAGTVDRFGFVYDEATVIDLKTTPPHPSHGLQLAAYDLLTPLPRQRRRVRMAIYLTPTRTSVRLYANPHDYGEWLDLVRRYHLEMSHDHD